MARKPVSHAAAPYEAAYEGGGSTIPRLIVLITLAAAAGAMVYRLRAPQSVGAHEPPTPTPRQAIAAASPAPEIGPSELSLPPTTAPSSLPTPAPLGTLAAPSREPSLAAPRVGIVAGHWGHDTGAVCPDGLREVDVNRAIAMRLVKLLELWGYEVDLLEEFDLRLHGYSADALISIHADSCEPFPDAVPPMTGFKVASVEDSWVPEEEEQLLACLADHYASRTGLHYHASTVTYDMTRYHTFYEIDGYTPAAIIETGFMYADRHIIAGQPDLIAQAIAEGIVCFLSPDEGET